MTLEDCYGDRKYNLLLFLEQKGSLYTQSSVLQVIMIIKAQEGIAG